MIVVREATEGDVGGIRDLFFATYDDDYTYKDYYDEEALKRIIWGDDTLLLVALDTGSGGGGGRLVGTASVLLEAGAYSDLVGEFGRLVVHPDHRGRGIGKKLMHERLERVQDRLHLGITEVRVVHPFTQRIALKQGFSLVGFLPLKWPLGGTLESQALLARYFSGALELRKNHPRVVPEIDGLASLAMENLGLRPDVILDESSAPYPPGGSFEAQELTTEGYSNLLRIERGRVRRREIFGPMRLHYGFFKLTEEHSKYLIAREDDHIAGALGYTVEAFDQLVRVFELIPVAEASIRFLFQELERRCREAGIVHYLEIDVRADAPRMQRTLIELGYLPVAYLPAMTFRRVERLDVVRMARLLCPIEPGPMDLLPPTRRMADLVLRIFSHRHVLPRIAAALEDAELFAGLTEEQGRRLATVCGHQTFEPGEEIFHEGESRTALYLVLSGEVEIEVAGRERPVGRVGAGECLGEGVLLEDLRHTATAIARTPVEVGVLPREELIGLIRRRADLGVLVYRNLARGLEEKLHRTDLARSDRGVPAGR
jgi:GNAT superfamily N-acetyltransferase